jgi:hypothetical protein
MQTNESHKIFEEALESYRQDKYFHTTEMSKDLGIPLTSLNYNMSGKRKWNADKWLLVMLYLGAAEVRGEKLIINTKFAKVLKDRVKKYKGL